MSKRYRFDEEVPSSSKYNYKFLNSCIYNIANIMTFVDDKVDIVFSKKDKLIA